MTKQATTKKLTLKQRLDRLPELPVETFEAAGELGWADNVPVVTIRPKKFPEPAKPAKPAGVLLAPKSQVEKRFYWVQVTYPKVFCYPPSLDLAAERGSWFVEGGTRESDKPNADLAAIAQRERFYKLTKLQGVRLTTSLWCSVKYGPWLARVVEEQSCIAGVPSRWQLNLSGTPDVVVTWYGEWEDIPPYPSLSVIMGDLALSHVEMSCCPGYAWCTTTMSCLPNQIPCHDPVPT